MQPTRLIHKNCQTQCCCICDGGLFQCTVCGGFEGTLTTHCCGRPLTNEEVDLIYTEERLNYRDGQWREESALRCEWVREEQEKQDAERSRMLCTLL